MELTVKFNTEELTRSQLLSLMDVIAGEATSADEAARETARKLHEEKVVEKDNDDATADEDDVYDPAKRVYGKAGEKSRRTKGEIAEDEGIAERWAAQWPSKSVPEKPVGELISTIEKVEASTPPDEDEGGFDVGEDDGDEVLDLEEFRAIIVKHSKALGGKKLGAIMAPYKNPAEVPEGERRDFADKIIDAACEDA